MSVMDDVWSKAALLLLVPGVLLVAALLLDASICIALALMSWLVAAVLLVYVPDTPEREDH